MLFILNRKQETVGVANNSSPLSLPYYDDSHFEDLDGVSTYTFTIPSDHTDSNLLEVNGYIVRKDLDDKLIMFTIKEIEEVHSNGTKIKNVFCENSAINELLGDVVRPMLLKASSVENALATVMTNSLGWKVGIVDYQASQDFELKEYITVLEAIRLIQEEYGCEAYFTVEMDGMNVVKKVVNLVEKMGQETNVRFEYGYDLKGVGRTEDSTRIITAIIPLGKGDTNNKRLTLQTYPAFDDGDFYKPSQVDWIGSDSALQQWSIDGNHIFGIYINENATTQAALKSSGIAELKRRMVPFIRYASSIQTFERLTGYEAKRVRLGDTVHIKDSTFNPILAISGRVCSVTRSYTDPLKDEINLGDYKPLTLSENKRIKQLQNLISLNEEKWNMSAYKVEISSTGGDVFKNGIGSTTLLAKVYDGQNQVDPNGTDLIYKWYKYDKDGNNVKLWGGATDYKTGRTLTVTDAEVDSKSTFRVDIETI